VEPLRGQTIAASACGDLLLLVHGACAASDEEWATLMDLSRALRPRALFVFTPAGCPGPTATQRNVAAGTWKDLGYKAPIVLLTESRLLRGMLTAIHWLSKQQATAYAPNDLGLACDALHVDARTGMALRVEAFAMAGHLGVQSQLAYLDPASGNRAVAV
jgi:hypothetical protein